MPDQSKDLMPYDHSQPLAVTKEQYALVKSTIFPEGNENEMQLFLYNCNRLQCHPLDRQLHPIVYNKNDKGKRKLVFIVGIDLLRANTNDMLDGMDAPEFGPVHKGGSGSNQWEYPEWCRINFWRKGSSKPIVAEARWKDYYPGEANGEMWRKRGHGQLEKCCEAKGRRMIKPSLFSGMYSAEELQNISETGPAPASFEDAVVEAETVEVKPEEPKAIEAPQLTVHQELMAMVLRYNGMRMDLIKQCVPQIAPEGKLLSDLDDAEAKTALAKLLKMNEPAAMPEYCTQTPGQCSLAMIEEGEYKCTGAKDGKKKVKLPCAFGIGMKA